MRHALLAACAPHLQDVAIAGAGRDRIALILFPTQSAIEQHPRESLRRELGDALANHNAAMPGSSTSIYRAILADGPPDRNAGEITDKGHLAQSRCLKNRAALVDRIYAASAQSEILCPDTLTNTD